MRITSLAFTPAGVFRLQPSEAYLFHGCGRELDGQILSVAETVSMGPSIKLVYTAHPSFFDALDAVSEEAQVHGVSYGNKLVGFGAIGLQNRFIEGKPLRIGYLSMLRLLREHRGKRLTSQAFSYLRHQQLGTNLFFASFVSSNKRAIKILTKKRGDYPFFYPVADVVTTLLLLQRSSGQPVTGSVGPPSTSEAADIISFLDKEGGKKHFFPKYKKADQIGLPLKHFVVARKGNHITGVCAVWDQTPFKQIVIQGYGYLAPLVQLYNLWPLKSLPKLPRRGKVLKFGYISHLAVKDNNPRIAAELLVYVRTRYASTLPLLAVGLDARDPLLSIVKGLYGIKYKSKVFLISWDDQSSLAARLRSGLVYPEIALL